MGALSAGDEKEAVACVYGTSVPLSVTRSLLAHQRETAVYLPGDGRPGRPDPVRLSRQRAVDQGHRDQPRATQVLGHRRLGTQEMSGHR